MTDDVGFYTSLKFISLRLRANGYINCVWGGSVPHLREGVELGGRVWYSVKARHNGHNLSIEIDTPSRVV